MTQISFAVTAKLISAFVFTTRIVQFLLFLNPKFQASSLLLLLYRSVRVRPDRKPRRPVYSRRGSYISGVYISRTCFPDEVEFCLCVYLVFLSWFSPVLPYLHVLIGMSRVKCKPNQTKNCFEILRITVLLQV